MCIFMLHVDTRFTVPLFHVSVDFMFENDIILSKFGLRTGVNECRSILQPGSMRSMLRVMFLITSGRWVLVPQQLMYMAFS